MLGLARPQSSSAQHSCHRKSARGEIGSDEFKQKERDLGS
jgi:hypothetical protein